jgi:1-aminocyclopropane-1-carboxylate deaminase
MIENLQNINLQHLPSFSAKDMPVAILRLDKLHPVVSGNKWFKLKYYLQDAIAQQKTTIATFGGAYSNHIVATAFAAKEAGLKSIGFIRGEDSPLRSPTLQHAMDHGMEIIYVDRETFRDKTSIRQKYSGPGFYWVMEGGYGILGSKGAADILRTADTASYTHILCAVGTGTMLSGLIRSALPEQNIIGISVLKNNFSLEAEARFLLDEEHKNKSFSINHDYHFGGYAKHPEELIRFMKETWDAEQLPTDIVYTSKLLFAVKDLVLRKAFPPQARILLIHSGGLQGNSSLPPGTLPFL